MGPWWPVSCQSCLTVSTGVWQFTLQLLPFYFFLGAVPVEHRGAPLFQCLGVVILEHHPLTHTRTHTHSHQGSRICHCIMIISWSAGIKLLCLTSWRTPWKVEQHVFGESHNETLLCLFWSRAHGVPSVGQEETVGFGPAGLCVCHPSHSFDGVTPSWSNYYRLKLIHSEAWVWKSQRSLNGYLGNTGNVWLHSYDFRIRSILNCLIVTKAKGGTSRNVFLLKCFLSQQHLTSPENEFPLCQSWSAYHKLQMYLQQKSI